MLAQRGSAWVGGAAGVRFHEADLVARVGGKAVEGGQTACVADGGLQRKTGGYEGCHEVGEGVGAVDEVRKEGAMGSQDGRGRQRRREGEDVVFGDLEHVRASCRNLDRCHGGLGRPAL
jgi:hypothetical protein